MATVWEQNPIVKITWDVPEEMSYGELHMWLSMMVGPFADQIVSDLMYSAESSTRWEDDGGVIWEKENEKSVH